MLIAPDKLGLERAADAIRAGELISFPTDTYFALGANGLNSTAVERVFEVKGRDLGTPVPLLLSDSTMLKTLCSDFPETLKKLAVMFWPGPLTIVLPASKVVPEAVTAGTGTVGVRVPNHDVARRLIELAGVPLTGTSCNHAGREPTKSAVVVDQIFGHNIAGCVDAFCGISSAPSTVVSLENQKVVLIREGAISSDSIQNVIANLVVNQ
ncbi:MAG: threonylcarbamoyl-AMP synthase [Chloroflexi bacterium]|nr:threonylcarbamoyl-AMP synthase [Chloroflexota bacterium]